MPLGQGQDFIRKEWEAEPQHGDTDAGTPDSLAGRNSLFLPVRGEESPLPGGHAMTSPEAGTSPNDLILKFSPRPTLTHFPAPTQIMIQEEVQTLLGKKQPVCQRKGHA